SFFEKIQDQTTHTRTLYAYTWLTTLTFTLYTSCTFIHHDKVDTHMLNGIAQNGD
ncbi:hypothetical protein COCVIDRAFT_101266, partial [Bipolaris victoriae FI3]